MHMYLEYNIVCSVGTRKKKIISNNLVSNIHKSERLALKIRLKVRPCNSLATEYSIRTLFKLE